MSMSLPKKENIELDRNSTKCHLVILEQPVQKFRFRYKSEMLGTHGCLVGVRSQRNKKTYPEVELRNFNAEAVLRCTLYQTHKRLLHPHYLVVHKDDMDACDPHDLHVSPQKGYIVRFENMSIIHTARKDVAEELLKKMTEKLKSELGLTKLSTAQEMALKSEVLKEAKAVDLHKTCLCFEAFKVVDGGRMMSICEPVFTHTISNRKSALTGELKICRLSIATGSAEGGDDLILLVEKVSKENIKVRFFQIENEIEVWEAFGTFTEADIHHQYAIVLRTPPYKNKNIEDYVNVLIELVREKDNERSLPVTFRYKPRESALLHKRRRVYNLSSETGLKEFCDEKEYESFEKQVSSDISMLGEMGDSFVDPNKLLCELVCDNVASSSWKPRNAKVNNSMQEHRAKLLYHLTIKRLTSVHNKCLEQGLQKSVEQTLKAFNDYVTDNDHGDTIAHDVVKQDSHVQAINVLKILSKLKLTKLLSQTNNAGQTPLHMACIFNQPAIIRPLIDLKCDANIQDIHGNTALHIAIAENFKACVDALVSCAAISDLNANLANYDGLTPLHLAIRKNNPTFVKILLEKCNASAKIANSRDGNNALHLAVHEQNPKIVKIILEQSNMKVNPTNQAGLTAVDIAKTLKGHMRKEILDQLYSFLPFATDAIPTTDFIKEEPGLDESSSSTDEDERDF